MDRSALRLPPPAVAIGVGALSLGLAIGRRFVQDDAFISFRYAANLAAGHGLVFNPGERVEGFTNPLWTMLMSLPIAMDLDPVPWSMIVGLCAFVLSLVATWHVARRVLRSREGALLALLFLGTNTTFHTYATGGLETSLHVALILSSLWAGLAAFPEGRPARLRFLGYASGLMGLACLARPDTLLLAGPLGLAALWVAGRDGRGTAGRARALALLALPLSAVVGAWLAYKLPFFGRLLPNTFTVKVGSGTSIPRGAYYVYAFFLSYLWLPFPFLWIATARRWVGRKEPLLTLLAGLSVAWLAWVVYVGGDFMEFRFMVPVLPFLAILLAWTVTVPFPQPALKWALTALIVAGSLHHALFFGKSIYPNEIMTFGNLESQMDGRAEGWIGVGKALGEAFGPGSDVVLATTAIGAIPFYSGLATVDMHGLTDLEVARHGWLRAGQRPGHQRMATMAYLRRRGVNLVIGHPWVEEADAPAPDAYGEDDLERIFARSLPPDVPVPDGASMAEIPMSDGRRLVALYLTPSPAVDAAALRLHWRIKPLRSDPGGRDPGAIPGPSDRGI